MGDFLFGDAGLAEHEAEDVAIEHAAGVDAVGGDGAAGEFGGGLFEGDSVSGAGFAEEGTVNVEEEEFGSSMGQFPR